MPSKRIVKPLANRARMASSVIGDRIDDLDLHSFELRRALAIQIEVRCVAGHVFGEHLRLGVNRFGDFFRGRATVADVVLDAEVAIRSTGVMAGREHDAAERAVLAHDCAQRRRRQDAALPHQHAGEAVGGSHAQDDLDGGAVEEAAIAADH
jgi:hypothetical protein